MTTVALDVAAKGVATRVKVLITIPTAAYYRLLGLCDVSTQEYRTLKHGVIRGIEDDDADETAVCLFCDSEDGKALLGWAVKVDPAAASQIKVDQNPTI